MRVDLKTAGVDLDEAGRASAERAFLLALGRVRSRVSHVALSLEPASREHTRGGPPWQVVAQVSGARRFLVIEVDRDLTSAVTRAADRVRRCVERDLSVEGWSPARPSGQRRHGTTGRRRGSRGLAADGPDGASQR